VVAEIIFEGNYPRSPGSIEQMERHPFIPGPSPSPSPMVFPAGNEPMPDQASLASRNHGSPFHHKTFTYKPINPWKSHFEGSWLSKIQDPMAAGNGFPKVGFGATFQTINII
jgi:hypothetical protein